MKAIKYFLQILFIFSTTLGFAQYVDELGVPNRLVGNALNGQPTINVQDSKFNQLIFPNNNFASVNSAVNIHIGFQDETNNFNAYNEIYTAKVKLSITSYGAGSSSLPTSETKEFTIVHNNNTEDFKHNDFVIYKLGGIHKADVKVLSVQYFNQSNNPIVLTNTSLYVELHFNTERYFNIKGTYVTPITSLITYNGLTELINNNTFTNGEDELKISWNAHPEFPAIEYELEWTWIDNYGNQNTILNANQIPLTEQTFKLNSTRIQTKDLSYRIPLIFSKGYLVYRVRPVGRFLDKLEKNYYGLWSSGLTETFTTVDNWPNKILIGKTHENGNKNWQYQTSFAEDGKKKEVVSYFDGSLRNRQTVTKINSNNQAIVGEVIYDNQGRAAIEVLPTPIDHRAIKYFGSLTKNNLDTAFSHYDFDWDKPGLSCTPSMAAEMSTSSGASKYYSGLSSPTNTFQDFVPDAQKYPYSQIVYTPDNTGRISKKGGVGKDHQIGKGHEMTYLYSTPSQEELNRLFGYKVGNFKRYKKNTVIDPNGQISFSYLDPQGRTVATALGSISSASPLDHLPDAAADGDLKTNLLSNNDKYSTGRYGILKDGIALKSQISVASQIPSDVFFNYQLSHSNNTFKDNCLTNKSYPFVYDVSISLKDNCAIEKLNFNTPLSANYQKIGVQNTSNPLGNTPAVNYQRPDLKATQLEKGTYSLSKDIKINKAALEAYADDYVSQIRNNPTNICYPPIKDYQVQIDLTDCEVTCKGCEKSLVKNYLSTPDYTTIENLINIDSTSIANRTALIKKAKQNYVLDKLNKKFTPTTFTYDAAGNLIYSTAGLEPVVIASEETKYAAEFDLSLKVCKELCPTITLTCDVNRSNLLTDISPKGQYGSIEGIIFDTPNGSSDTNNNTSDPDPLPTSPIQVVKSDLSVFNEYNKLLKRGISPPNPNNPTIRGNQSKSSWKFPNPNHKYKNEDGTPSEIKVELIGGTGSDPLKADGNEVYKPSIEPNTVLKRIPEEEGFYYVNPEDLDNIADFINAWQPSWAESLIIYHPEYNYLEYYKELCEKKSDSFGKTRNTDEYDDYLNSINTFVQAYSDSNPNRRLIDATPTTAALSNIVISANDPFYNANYSNVETSGSSNTQQDLRQRIMKEALTTKYDGMYYKNGTEKIYLNMFEASVYTVLFGNGLAPISEFHNARTSLGGLLAYIRTNPNVTQPQRDRIWQTFKNNYISLKTKTKTVFSNIYALKNGGYNGYIGNAQNTEDYRFLFRKYSPEIFDKITQQINLTLGVHSNLSHIENNGKAISSDECKLYYEEKIKRFISADYSYNPGLDDEISAEQAEHDADDNLFRETGKCPLLLDVEHFLNALVRKDEIFNPLSGGPRLPLSAADQIPANSVTPLTKDLYDNLGGANVSGIPMIEGQTVDANTLKIIVGAKDPITLKIVQPPTYVSSCDRVRLTSPTERPTWNNYSVLFDIKEFKNITSVGGTPGNYKFKAIAIIEFRNQIAGSQPCQEQMLIEGSTSAPLNTCKLDGTLGQSGQASTEAGGGCANKMRFEKNLLQLLNRLREKRKVRGVQNVNLGMNYSNTTPINMGEYNYGNSFLADFLGDTDLTAQYSTSPQSFIITRAGNTLVNVTLNGDFPSDNDSYRFSGISINNNNQIKIYYVTNTDAQLHELEGNITTRDFQCICKDRVPVQEVAQANFLKLINHLWVTQKNNNGQMPNNNASYNPQQWQDLDPYVIPNGSTIDNFISNWTSTENTEINTTLGLTFNFAKNCNFTLPVSSCSYRACGRNDYSDYFNSVTNFSNFKVLGETFLGSGIWNFRVIAHNSPYTLTDDPRDNIPAGQQIIYGTVSCLEKLICKEQIDVQNNLQQLISLSIGNPSSFQGSTPASLAALPIDMPITSPKVIYNYTSTLNPNTNTRSIAFNFGKNVSCGIKINFPNGPAGSTPVFSNLVFDNTNYTNFTFKVTYNNNTTAIGTGTVSCLKLDSCSQEVEVPCINCIPPQVEPVLCGPKWREFKDRITSLITGYQLPKYLATDDAYFCGANYGYISSQYLSYLTQLGIHSTDHPNYISIGEFGATKLNYGYTGMDDAITAYVQYLSDNTIATPKYSWVNFINLIYYKENKICPPAPLVPNINLSVGKIPTPCEIFNYSITATYSAVLSEQYFKNKREEFIYKYINDAIGNLKEIFTKKGQDNEYQYTLYYYDQAGNLTQTVPPKGVNRLPITADTDGVNVEINRIRDNNLIDNQVLPVVGTMPTAPNHNLKTEYKYNSLNQLVWQKTPDGGETRFAYDNLGRIIASQNAKQAIGEGITKFFSYTRYDELGRIFEAGEIATTIDEPLYSINDSGKLIWTAATTPLNEFSFRDFKRRQVTYTRYDEQHPDATVHFGSTASDNNQKRVTAVLYFDTVGFEGIDQNKYDNAIFYDYDIHGNVKQLVQYNNTINLVKENRAKKVVYDYDLISGNVNKVTYQPGQKDQFIHKYSYDADNRIIDVKTSNDAIVWEKDAQYQYYQHGPLARVVIGDKKVQGLDYIYTLQGWLKGVNSEQVGTAFDAGKDGRYDGLNNVAQDAMAFALNYYSGDYISRHNATTNSDASIFSLSKGLALEGNKNLFNGNIKEMVTSLLKEDQNKLNSQFNYYTYDQLNRIKAMNSKAVLPNNTTHNSYSSSYEYDPNGNLSALKRFAPVVANPTSASDYKKMDDFTYKYKDGNNQLTKVFDAADDLFPGTSVDIKKNSAELSSYNVNNEATHNYIYDNIGQLIRDKSEGLTIDWRVDGKVNKVTKDNGTIISFAYDGLGNRISKTVSVPNQKNTTTYYQRDAQGNVLAVYEGTNKNTSTAPPIAPEIYLNNHIVTGTEIHKATNAIYVSNAPGSISKVTTTGNLTLQATNEIVFSNGFSTEGNGTLLAQIKPIEDANLAQNTYKLIEHDIYGSSRIGIQNESIDLVASTNKVAPAKTLVTELARQAPIVTAVPVQPVIQGIRTNTNWNSNSQIPINFFAEAGEVNDSISMKLHMKIDENTNENSGKNIATLQNYLYLNPGNFDSGSYYNSIISLRVEKKGELYFPYLEIIKYKRIFGKRNGNGGRSYYSYENFKERIVYLLKIGIPENEWDIKAIYFAKEDKPEMIINGNRYTLASFNRFYNPRDLQDTHCRQDGPWVRAKEGWYNQAMIHLYPKTNLSNYLGDINITYSGLDDDGGCRQEGLQITPTVEYKLPAEICDFTYQIDQYKHAFSFDRTPKSISSNIENKDEVVSAISMNGIADSDYTNTYCGPQALDSDLDGILDEKPNGERLDNCRFTFNPGQEDADGDGYGDVCDNCRKPNPTPHPTNRDYQTDDDGDGVGNDCDNCPTRINPRIPYTGNLADNDPLMDDTFIKINNVISYQPDTDRDGYGDGCDNCKTIPNGLAQASIPNVGNQLDTDNDGIGNACEGQDQGSGSAELVQTPVEGYRHVGDKNYELSNHLGNVLSVISDRKLFVKNPINSFTFMPDVLSFNDYYPFGSLIPNRHGSSTAYRYGFNGMEKDDELKGFGNSYDFGARMLDTRVGRWFARDPLESKYANLSPYVFGNNNPIYYLDPDGKDILPTPAFWASTYGTIYNDLITKSSTFNQILLPYKNDKKLHLIFDINHAKATLNGKFANTYAPTTQWRYKTDPKKPEPGTFQFLSNTAEYYSNDILAQTQYQRDSNGNILGQRTIKYSQLFIAACIIHESIHALVDYKERYNTSRPGDQSHSKLNDNRELFIKALTEYVKGKNLLYTEQDIEDIAWHGTESSKQFNSHFEELAKKNGTTKEEEIKLWDERQSKLSFDFEGQFKPVENKSSQKDENTPK